MRKEMKAAVTGLLLALGACSSPVLEGGIVLASPTGGLEIIIERTSNITTIADLDAIYIRAVGARRGQKVMTVEAKADVAVSWTGPYSAQIRMGCGRIYDFRNYAIVKVRENLSDVYVSLEMETCPKA
jgi:hypothetical protein